MLLRYMFHSEALVTASYGIGICIHHLQWNGQDIMGPAVFTLSCTVNNSRQICAVSKNCLISIVTPILTICVYQQTMERVIRTMPFLKLSVDLKPGNLLIIQSSLVMFFPKFYKKYGLVLSACACAALSVYFTIKMSVKVQVNCVHTRKRFTVEVPGPESHVFSGAPAHARHRSLERLRAYRVELQSTIVQWLECLSVLWQHSASQALHSSVYQGWP